MTYEIDVQAVQDKQYHLKIPNIELAKRLGINRNTLRSYYEKPNKVPYGIIVKMVEELELTREEAGKIFFSIKLTHEKDEGKGKSYEN